MRDVVSSSGATYEWQRTSSAGWRAVGPTSDTRDVEFDTAGTRIYRAVVNLGSGVELASDPVSITWRPRALLTADNLSPARGEPVVWVAGMMGRGCGSADYAWYRVDPDGTDSPVEPDNSDTKTGMFFRTESKTYWVEITCSDDEGNAEIYTSDHVTVTATDEIWPYASVTSDDDDNVVPVGTKVVLTANLQRRNPPLNW